MQLSKLETDAHLDVPRDVGGLVKRFANDPTYARLWSFLCDDIGRAGKLSYVPGQVDARDLMIWFEGRRFIGVMLQRIAAAPMPDETPPEPPARTMSERQRRRATKTATDKG